MIKRIKVTILGVLIVLTIQACVLPFVSSPTPFAFPTPDLTFNCNLFGVERLDCDTTFGVNCNLHVASSKHCDTGHPYGDICASCRNSYVGTLNYPSTDKHTGRSIDPVRSECDCKFPVSPTGY